MNLNFNKTKAITDSDEYTLYPVFVTRNIRNHKIIIYHL